nr:tetratricopeptide repeat protein [Pseudomonas aromaticivorans]
MLRDLEARRAPPAERAPLEGLLPADETAVGRRADLRRVLLALPWLLLALLAALLLSRLWSAPAVSDNLAAPAAAEPAPAVATPSAAEAPIQLLAALPQHGDGRFVLQLLLDRAPAYQRSEQSGVVSLRLPHLRLSDGGPREGRFEHGGRSLNWSLSAVGDGAELLLVGLGDALQVRDRLEPAGERWQLWIEVPLVAEADDFDPARLPVAGAEEPAAPLLADYPAAPRVEAKRAVEPSGAEPAPRAAQPPVRTPADEPAVAPRVARSPQVNVASHQPDALSEARQALLAGERSRAIGLLEELNRRQPENGEALRWLARAWLADGRGERLIAELPARLQRFPADSELRLLLARAQLQAGDSAAAVATLAAHLPPLAGDPAYHALLAASYQQTGQWRESAQLYRNLVLLRPEQSAWQLGLGIALEQLGERAAAAQHYRQALQGQGLDDGSRRYARERAQALGGAS